MALRQQVRQRRQQLPTPRQPRHQDDRVALTHLRHLDPFASDADLVLAPLMEVAMTSSTRRVASVLAA